MAQHSAHASDDAAAHAAHLAHVDHHVKQAKMVFGALIVLTFVTVAAWKIHLPHAAAIGLALMTWANTRCWRGSFTVHVSSEPGPTARRWRPSAGTGAPR